MVIERKACMLKGKCLDDLLEECSVIPAGCWENTEGPEGYAAVCNDEGIIAYFLNDVDAFRFRLDLINRTLNP